MQIIHQLLAMHQRQPEAEELAQAIVALQSVTTDLAMLSILPADRRREILSRLPPEKREPIVSELHRRARHDN